jgi:hypothetical protein
MEFGLGHSTSMKVAVATKVGSGGSQSATSPFLSLCSHQPSNHRITHIELVTCAITYTYTDQVTSLAIWNYTASIAEHRDLHGWETGPYAHVRAVFLAGLSNMTTQLLANELANLIQESKRKHNDLRQVRT